MNPLRRLLLLVFCGLALAPLTLSAQSAADSVRVRRPVALCKLWNAARFLHPYLAYRDIDWDSALVAAIPRVRAAGTSDGYAAAGSCRSHRSLGYSHSNLLLLTRVARL